MKLQDQLTNLKLSKELKKLGVKQDSLWTWVLGCNNGKITTEYKLVIIGNRGFTDYVCAGRDNKEAGEMFSAFSVAELGEMIKNIHEAQDTYNASDLLFIWDDKIKMWTCEDEVLKIDALDIEDKFLANALAKMLIYLLKNKLINPN